MQLAYVLKDNQGHSGQTLPLTQGETRTVTCFLFNADGTPYAWQGTLSELVVKCYANVSAPSIQKKYSLSQVTPVTASGGLAGIIGFQFTLAAVDTTSMTPNSTGLPMTATLTDASGNVTELDFLQAFNVVQAAVLT